MTPSISSRFNLNTLQLRVTDTFNYSSIIYESAFGNVTARIGNSVFHTNNQFNNNADIVIGTNTFIDIDLPQSNGLIQSGSYSIDYNLLVNYKAAVQAPSASPFVYIELAVPSQQFINQIQELVDDFGNIQIQFLNASGNVLATSTVTGTGGDDTIDFDAVTLASFATITDIRISYTYTLSKEYLFDNCDVVQGLSLNTIVDCFRAQITLQDTTAYPAFVSSLTRQMTLRYPRLADGTEVLSPVTTTNPSLTVGPTIWTGGYVFALQSEMTWTQPDDLIILQTLTTQMNKDVQCDLSLCKAAKCVDSLRLKLQEAIRLGDRNMNELLLQNIVVLGMCNAYNLFLTCQDSVNAGRVLAELTQYLDLITDGACGCGCQPTSEVPTQIYPLFSSTELINGLESTRNYE